MRKPHPHRLVAGHEKVHFVEQHHVPTPHRRSVGARAPGKVLAEPLQELVWPALQRGFRCWVSASEEPSCKQTRCTTRKRRSRSRRKEEKKKRRKKKKKKNAKIEEYEERKNMKKKKNAK